MRQDTKIKRIKHKVGGFSYVQDAVNLIAHLYENQLYRFWLFECLASEIFHIRIRRIFSNGNYYLLMDEKKRIEEEIERLTELIRDSETALENVPIHLRPSQEFVIEILRKELDSYKQELAKLES